MKVVAITGPHKTGIFEIDKPIPGSGQVLIRIHACALCTFEQRMFTQETKKALPYVGGHEFAGVIEELGSDVEQSDYPLGTKVAVRGLRSCGTCYFCRHGEENLCIKAYKKPSVTVGTLTPNGLGEYIAVNTTQVYKLASDISYEQAVFVEPFACVINSIQRGRIELGDDIVVIGGGIMGILHAIASKMSGARVILSEPDPKRAEMAKKYGADIVINPKEEDMVAQVKLITGNGANVVFDTTPNAAIVSQAIDMTAPLGRCIVYSSIHPDTPIQVSPNFIHNTEITITGAKSPSVRSFDTAAGILSKKLVDLRPLLTESYEKEDADIAFERACSMDTYRVMIKF